MKSTVDEIRQRFDGDVQRFSSLETGQAATVDAPLALELIAEAAATVTPRASAVLDIGCGAGNYTLRLLQNVPGLSCTLIDLSRPMLDRAQQRVSVATSGVVRAVQGDIRDEEIGESQFDIVMAAAVLHHLRTEDEWKSVFAKIYRSLRVGGSFWITDLITHTTTAVQELMWRRYGDYLEGLKDGAYRDHVFAYIEKEDTPRPLLFQIDLMRSVGFQDIELLHKNSCFAAFGGRK